jgi:hypothetical protein
MAGDVDVAQARILAAALEEQIAEMPPRLSVLRERIGPHPTSRNLALRREANGLFNDISKALHACYLTESEATA